jgi:hypothetical protein
MHAEVIFEIIANSRYELSSFNIFFAQRNDYNPENYFYADDPLGFFAESADGISSENLILHGLNYSFHEDHTLYLLTDFTGIIQSCISNDDSTKNVSLSILRAKEKAKQRIGKFFVVSSLEIIKRFGLEFPLVDLEKGDIDKIIGEAVAMLAAPETAGIGWMILGYCGTEWLTNEQRIEAQSRIPQYQIVNELLKNRELGFGACQVFMDFAIRRGSVTAQESVQSIILDFATHLGSTHKGIDCAIPNSKIHDDFVRLFKVIFVASKSYSLESSIEILDKVVRGAMTAWPESITLWKPIINNLNKNIRFEYTELLWKLYNEMKSFAYQ